MPKKTKIYTKILYTYVRPVNDDWVRRVYKKLGFRSRSEFVDTLISNARVAKRVRTRVQRKSA